MTIKHITANADGTIVGLRVVGFHGRLGPSQTPARRSPVYVDDEGLPVRVRKSEPAPEGGFSLTVELGAKPIPSDVWTTTGTAIEPPWPASLTAPLIVVIGERELRVVHELRRVEHADGPEQDQVTALLAWAATETPRSDTLRCVRVGELVAWNCTRALADALCARVAIVARRQVMDAARMGQSHELRRASFWLSRAAVRDADVFLAAAGLRRAGFEQWEELLHAGVQSGTTARRLASVDAAEATLPTPPRVRSSLPGAAQARFLRARKAVSSSQDDLAAASRRAAEGSHAASRAA